MQTFCTYGVYGKEKGELCGTPHIQFYFELPGDVQWSLKTLRRKGIPKRTANMQPRYSQYPKEAAGYCKKGNTPKDQMPQIGWIYFFDNPAYSWDGYEYGTIKAPGTRTDACGHADLTPGVRS